MNITDCDMECCKSTWRWIFPVKSLALEKVRDGCEMGVCLVHFPYYIFFQVYSPSVDLFWPLAYITSVWGLIPIAKIWSLLPCCLCFLIRILYYKGERIFTYWNNTIHSKLTVPTIFSNESSCHCQVDETQDEYLHLLTDFILWDTMFIKLCCPFVKNNSMILLWIQAVRKLNIVPTQANSYEKKCQFSENVFPILTWCSGWQEMAAALSV